jgi:hypothetical protein
LCCLFFNIRILIALLVSSNSSCPFVLFSFGHFVVCSSSIYGFWLAPFGIFNLFLSFFCLFSFIFVLSFLLLYTLYDCLFFLFTFFKLDNLDAFDILHNVDIYLINIVVIYLQYIIKWGRLFLGNIS